MFRDVHNPWDSSSTNDSGNGGSDPSWALSYYSMDVLAKFNSYCVKDGWPVGTLLQFMIVKQFSKYHIHILNTILLLVFAWWLCPPGWSCDPMPSSVCIAWLGLKARAWAQPGGGLRAFKIAGWALSLSKGTIGPKAQPQALNIGLSLTSGWGYSHPWDCPAIGSHG
ncbi:hypothetical protein EDC04DRAFT_2613230 [Pisolithus marmoratus]|nr:hypothetical protein EDC04DRAFT_2613230 [Pisolithus marmoratus]